MTTVSPLADSARKMLTLHAGDLRFELTSSGDIHAIHAADLLVNQFQAQTHDVSASGVYLRRHSADAIDVQQIMGSAPAVESFEVGEGRVAWTGRSLGVDHRVELTVTAAGLWVWQVTLSHPESDTEYDVVIAQDLALSPPGAALSSEPYVCQYIVHRVLEHADGPVLASRQTMTAAPRLPLVVSGIVEGASGYLTDALQTHTPHTRLDGIPHGLTREVPSANYQYELSMPTLVSRRLNPTHGPARIHGYTVFQVDVPGDLTQQTRHLDGWAAAAVHAATQDIALEVIPVIGSLMRDAAVLSGRDVSDAELLDLAGVDTSDVLLPETSDAGHLLSFFTPASTHVVRGVKDLMVERSHGHVLKAGDAIAPTDDVLSATAYAPGVFASHVVLGNTTVNRLVTVQRHHLNLIRTSGIRLLVGAPGHDGGNAPLRLLGTPSMVSFDIGGVHWVYLTELGRIDVRTVAAAHSNRIDVLVESDAELRMIATIDLEIDPENPQWVVEHHGEEAVRFRPAAHSTIASRYPDLTYLLQSSAPVTDDAGLFRAEADEAPAGRLLVSEATGRHLELTITGSLTTTDHAVEAVAERLDVGRELTDHVETMRSLTLGLRLGGESAVPSIELDTLVPWYVHDGLIHFLVPHGLEQYSGAAWGARDAAQGPFELHLASGRFDIARQIVLTLFAHQHPVGDFPQWFMFDEYVDLYSDDSHGDVVVWPLFALGQYLLATGDLAVLDTQLPFWNDGERRPGDVPVSLLAHVEQLLTYLDEHRLPGTALPAYGHGDWDDTLQPADPTMRISMASGWTAALLTQAATMTAGALETHAGDATYDALTARLRAVGTDVAVDLRKHLLVDGVTAGYLSLTDGHEELVIHPRDNRTGITYRLIPMTRSIIAGVLDPAEASAHERIIREHLHFPDGVRLMDRPAAFDDGVPHVFLRAEQAASVGREVGLMYTHAHIRWVEALAAMGRPDALDELIRISPLGINERLPHAERRQRNVYYSSSDGAFPDRYSFAEGFDLLRTGEVGVRGGWRVYSSGPGIFLRQLVQGVLGLVVREGSVVFDPVLPAEAEGLTVEVDLAGERRTVRYALAPEADQVRVRGGDSQKSLRPLEGIALTNRYRHGGLELDTETLRGCAVLEVTVPVRG